MFESTMKFDDVRNVLGLLPLLWVVQRSHIRSRKSSGANA